MPGYTAEVYSNTNNDDTVYKYRASGYYMLGTEKFIIDNNNIISIVVDHDYINNNMPLMYLIMSLSTKTIDKIVRNKETGVFIISIQKCVDNSDMAELWEDYVSDTFVYFLAEDINKTDSRDYENANDGREDIYKEITVGLLSQNLVNNNKKTVNGVLVCNDMASAVAYTIGTNRPLVMEPFENNIALNRIIMPPRNSVAKSISYLNSIKTFYNTNYLYYMDYDVSYLLSSRGKAVPRKGDKVNTVMVVLRNDYDTASKLQGMSLDSKNRYYKVEVGATSVELADYSEDTKSYTNISYTNTTGNNQSYQKTERTQTSNFVNKTVQVRVPNDNDGLILNSSKISGIKISINKTDLDASVFTPNKEYIINADDVYSGTSYSGKYLLRRKRELYFKSSGTGMNEKFILNTMLLFERVFEQ